MYDARHTVEDLEFLQVLIDLIGIQGGLVDVKVDHFVVSCVEVEQSVSRQLSRRRPGAPAQPSPGSPLPAPPAHRSRDEIHVIRLDQKVENHIIEAVEAWIVEKVGGFGGVLIEVEDRKVQDRWYYLRRR